MSIYKWFNLNLRGNFYDLHITSISCLIIGILLLFFASTTFFSALGAVMLVLFLWLQGLVQRLRIIDSIDEIVRRLK